MGRVLIVKAFPASEAGIVSEIKFEEGETPQELYIDGDKLVVIGQKTTTASAADAESTESRKVAGSTGGVASSIAIDRPYPYYDYRVETFVKVYDVSGKAEPKLKDSYLVTGSYYDSRMIDGRVHVIANQSISRYPVYRLSSSGSEAPRLDLPVITANGVEEKVPATGVYHFGDYHSGYQFTTVLSVDLQGGKNSNTFLTGYNQSMFVSLDNVYLTSQEALPPGYRTQKVLEQVRQNAQGLAPGIDAVLNDKTRTSYERERRAEELVMFYALAETAKEVLPSSVAGKIENAVNNAGLDSEEKLQELAIAVEEYQSSLSAEERERIEQYFQKALLEKMTKVVDQEKIQEDIYREEDKSVVHKLSITGSGVEYSARGEVPGSPLNQFSMDEHDGYFRIATTSERFSGFDRMPIPLSVGIEATRTAGVAVPENSSEDSKPQGPKNNVYVLDGELNVVGKVEGLAVGETIYSARFLGDRAYLVTFKKVDPLFVLDLSSPENPRVLGKLKIPGFSDYLHPYDETHIIGVGKEAVEAREGDFAWYQGLKLALFDVSDPENPAEVGKYVIGDRGTDSYALQDHHAFLFNKNKDLLVIPVLLAEFDDKTGPVQGWEYGEYKWQGAYVFNLTLEKGFELKGRVTHSDSGEKLKQGFYYYGDEDSVKRSLFIDGVLYTVSGTLVKANSLEDLKELKQVSLKPEVLTASKDCGWRPPEYPLADCEAFKPPKYYFNGVDCAKLQRCSYAVNGASQKPPFDSMEDCEAACASGLEEFCGTSTEGECASDDDCVTGGGCGPVCQGAAEEPVNTTCEYRECYDSKKYGVECGCVEGKCQWA